MDFPVDFAQACRMRAPRHHLRAFHRGGPGRRVLVLACLALACLELVPPAKAQAQPFRDWVLERDEATCVISTRVHLRSTDTLLVAVSLSADGAGGALMAAEVPVGASLRERIAYVHAPGAPETTLEWQYCDARTCMATATIDAGALAALKAGARITVAFRPLPASPVLATPISLMGLTRAWDALVACNAAAP